MHVWCIVSVEYQCPFTKGFLAPLQLTSLAQETGAFVAGQQEACLSIPWALQAYSSTLTHFRCFRSISSSRWCFWSSSLRWKRTLIVLKHDGDAHFSEKFLLVKICLFKKYEISTYSCITDIAKISSCLTFTLRVQQWWTSVRLAVEIILLWNFWISVKIGIANDTSASWYQLGSECEWHSSSLCSRT